MELAIFFTLICIISALFVITKWFNIGIIYGLLIVLSLLGIYLAINSPIQVIESWDYKYTYNNSIVTNVQITPITTDTTVLNNSILLLFIASLISSVMLWITDNKGDDD